MKNIKKMIAAPIAALVALPLTVFSAHVGGSIGLESGYRSDTIRSTFTFESIPISSRVKDINGINLGLSGRLTIDDFYIRGNGDYVWILQAPEYSDSIGLDLPLSKEHGWDAAAAIGYNLYTNKARLSLAPEVGFSYQSLDLAEGITHSAGTPFIGFDFGWMLSSDWKLGLLFNWNMFGLRKSDALDGTLKVTEGYFMGPEAKISFDYSSCGKWSIGFAYRLKYIYSTVESYAFLVDEQKTWLSNNATIKVGYTF